MPKVPMPVIDAAALERALLTFTDGAPEIDGQQLLEVLSRMHSFNLSTGKVAVKDLVTAWASKPSGMVGAMPAQRMLRAADMFSGSTSSLLPPKHKAASLGVVRLDYDYPPAPGDIDNPDSFGYDVFYRVVPGLTFEMCQSGVLTSKVEAEFVSAVHYLAREKGVTGITGDCGFMMYFQNIARRCCELPIFMSSLAQLPAVTCGYASDELIAIFTASGKNLEPMRELFKRECGVDPDQKRFIIVGCEDIAGFEAVAEGGKVDVSKVTPGMVQRAKEVIAKEPHLRAILLECTELPPYSDAIRAATGLPVYDAITACDFFISGAQDNKRFGTNDWQHEWDGVQEQYTFGANLTSVERQGLVNVRQSKPMRRTTVHPNRVSKG